MAKTNNRTLRLLAEGTAIVASILLAFAIQAWWDEGQEKEDAERLLSSILVEYKTNVEAVKEANLHRQAVEDSIRQLFKLAAAPKDPDPKVVDELIGALTYLGGPPVIWGSLESLVEGGRLPLIENIELRNRLTELHRFKHDFEATQTQELAVVDKLVPFLLKHALLPQIASTSSATHWPGTGVAVYDDFDIPLRSPRNHSDLLKNSEFLGVLTIKLWLQLDAIKRNNRFLAFEPIINLIEERLGIETDARKI